MSRYDFPQSGGGNPYIHLTWSGYKRNIASGINRAEIKDQIRNTYAQNRMEMTSRFENEVNSDPDLVNILDTISELHNGLLGSNGQKILIDQSNLQKTFNNVHSNIRKTGLHASIKSEKINDIISDVDETINLIKNLNNILEEFEKLDKDLIAYCLKKKLYTTSEVSFGNLSSLQMFTERNQALTSLKKLVEQTKTLEVACAFHSSNATSIDKGNIKNEDALEILKGISGHISNLTGMAFEEMIYRIYQAQFAKIFKKSLGTASKGIKEVKIVSSHNEYNKLDESSKKIRSTSDIQIEIYPVEGKGKIVIGLSLKAQRKNKDAKKTKTNFKSGMNWSEFFQRSNILNTSYEYWLGNLILRNHAVNKRSDEGFVKNFYELTLIKKLVAAKGAVNSVAGPGGDTHDTAFFLVYMDKIMTVSEFFKNMVKDDRKGLNITTKGENEVEVAPKEPDILRRFIRSRATLESIRRTVKITVTK